MLLPCRLEVCTEQIERSRDGHAAEVRSAPASYRQGPTLHFSVTNHKHKRHLRLLRFSNFKPNLFIPKVCLSTKSRSLELTHDLGHVWTLIVRDRHDQRLNRGEPCWEGAAEVLNQNAKEPFDRPHQGPMDHDRLVHLAIFPNIA